MIGRGRVPAGPELTGHARERMVERQVEPWMAEAVLLVGQRGRHRRSGQTVYWMDRMGLLRIGGKAESERLLGLVLCLGDDGQIVTMYRSACFEAGKPDPRFTRAR